jgi:cytochrome P450
VLYLAFYPRWWERLVDEARHASGPPQSPAELKRFPVAEALFREVLRLNPPAVFSIRTVEKEIVLLGRRLPVGATVELPLFCYLRSPAHYPEPDVFRPERWLDGASRPAARYENAAFGYGAHFCLGYHLAWFEIVQFAVILANTMRAAGLRPRLTGGELPPPIYFPILRPRGDPQVQFHRGPPGE